VEATLDTLLERHRQVADTLKGGAAALPALQSTIADLRAALRPAIGRTLTPAERDLLLGQGEILSSRLVEAALAHAGQPVTWVDARRVIITDDRHGRATPRQDRIREAAAAVLAPLLAAGRIPLTQGFIGANAAGRPTILGRGGSDFTASLLGAALDAVRVEIWTDVNGLMTADPRIVPEARTLASATYDEAAELATFGAKVLHPATQLPLAAAGIPIVILNAQHADQPGTIIGPTRASALRADGPIGSISWKPGAILLNVRAPRMLGAYGFLRQLFEVFERHEVPVDVLASSEVSVSLTVEDRSRLDGLVRDLMPLGEVTVNEGRAIVAVVGHGMLSSPGVAARVFKAVQPANIEVISQGASATNLTFVVRENDGPAVVQRLHREFFGEA
jgi:aspartate kinase